MKNNEHKPPVNLRSINSLATMSLIFGILCQFILPLPCAIVAIIAGTLAAKEAAHSQITMQEYAKTRTAITKANIGKVLGLFRLTVILLGWYLLY